MPQVRHAVSFDRVLKHDGIVHVHGLIPQRWDDYVGVVGTMNNPVGWIASVVRSGNDDFTVHIVRRNSSGELEDVPADTRVRFTLDIIGNNND